MEKDIFIDMFDTEAGYIPAEAEPEKSGPEKTEKNEQKEEREVFERIEDIPDKEKDTENKKGEKVGETEEAEETKETKETPSKESADSSKFPYSTFAKALYEEGVLPFFDEDKFKELTEETGSEVEALIVSIGDAIEERSQKIINDLPEEGKKFIEAVIKGVPISKYINIKADEEQYINIKDTDLSEDDDLCKKLIKEDFKRNTRLDADEIEDQIKDFESLGKLEQKAKVALKRLKISAEEQLKAEKAAAETRNNEILEANKRQMTAIKQKIESMSEIIPGVKINTKLKGELYDSITVPAEQLPNGQYVNAIYAKRAKDPVSWDIKVAYLDKLGVFDGDWSKVISTGKTKAVNELTEKLKTGVISTTGNTEKEQRTSSKDILKSMEIFKRK